MCAASEALQHTGSLGAAMLPVAHTSYCQYPPLTQHATCCHTSSTVNQPPASTQSPAPTLTCPPWTPACSFPAGQRGQARRHHPPPALLPHLLRPAAVCDEQAQQHGPAAHAPVRLAVRHACAQVHGDIVRGVVAADQYSWL
jgi:hypothetical protein